MWASLCTERARCVPLGLTLQGSEPVCVEVVPISTPTNPPCNKACTKDKTCQLVVSAGPCCNPGRHHQRQPLPLHRLEAFTARPLVCAQDGEELCVSIPKDPCISATCPVGTTCVPEARG